MQWFEAVTIEKLSLYGAFQNIEVSSVALLFNFLLLMIIEVQRIRQKQSYNPLSFVVLSVMLANVVTCLYVFLAYADIGIGNAAICVLQSVALMCNVLVCYLFGSYVRLFVNRMTHESASVPFINKMMVALQAVFLTSWLIFAIPYIMRGGTLIRPSGLFYILVGFALETWHMVYALGLIVQKRRNLELRSQTTVLVTFFLIIATVMLQAWIGRAPVINYLGATFGLFVFYFSAETPEVIRLNKTLEELAESRKRAEEANRAKSEFLANMSHEMRTPLGAVLGMNEMILRESKNAEITGYAKSVERAGKSLLAVINDVLDYSRIESGMLKIINAPYSLSDVLGDVCDMMLFRAEQNGLSFHVNVDPSLPDRFSGDEIRIRQVLINLLNNAIKFTREGSVTLEVWGTPPQSLNFTITDTGIGIRPEDMERLFGKFERFDMEQNNSIEGAGLGLAITHSLVTMMGGEIRADSAYGEGSVFEVRIPQEVLGDEPVGDFREKIRNRTREEKIAWRVSFTAPEANILVVDDTAVNLTVFRKLLEKTRMLIDIASSGLDALAMTQDTGYDLIFLDQRMSGMDGAKTLAHIRSQEGGLNRETPVVCLTADAVAGAREKYMAMGFTDYLAKPIDAGKLEETVVRYLPAEKVLGGEDVETLPPPASGVDEGKVQEDGHNIRLFFDRTGILSYRTALRNCVDDETLFVVLQEYYENIPENAGLLSRYAADGDTESYTVKVHSLKNVCKMIGALELAEKAYRLEQAGEEGLADVIKEQTPALIEAYLETRDILEPLMEEG